MRTEDLPKGSIDTSGTIGGTSPSNTFQGQLSELKGKVNDCNTNVMQLNVVCGEANDKGGASEEDVSQNRFRPDPNRSPVPPDIDQPALVHRQCKRWAHRSELKVLLVSEQYDAQTESMDCMTWCR